MSEIKRRTRTGCLTCRARRVKCDERKPACNRCTIANVECAGYAPKRHIDVRMPQRASQSQQSSPADVEDDDVRSDRLHSSPQGPPGSTPSGPPSGPASAPSTHPAACILPRPQFRHDGLPLVGLPSNPRLSQRPCAASREVLAYHQFFFRTLPMLFPADHLPFWRDRLCDEAWCLEYAQRGLLALGCMHRAALMISMLGENDQARGLDTKVIAVQGYTQALQELSSQLDEAEKQLEVLSAVLVLMAYFECFASNIPAAYSHVCTANYYFTALKSNTPAHVDDLVLDSLGTALQTLTWTCYMAVPLPGMLLSVGRTTTTGYIAQSPSFLQRSLLQILIDSGVHNEIWTLTPVRQEPSVLLEKVYRLQRNLREWKDVHGHLHPNLEADAATMASLESSEEYHFPIPPSPFLALPSNLCLSGAMYNFLMARIMWTLCLYDKSQDAKKMESEAYIYFYQTMRFAATHTANNSLRTLPNGTYSTDAPVASEEMDKSFLPILYITGQCSPQPSWLRWIAQLMKQIGEQGLFNGFVLSASLKVLHKMELSHNLLSTDRIERYPNPALRIISMLIPETNAQGFVCYYAKPSRFNSGWINRDTLTYYPIAHARFSPELDEDSAAKREIEVYDEQRSMEEQFTSEWILSRPVASSWQTRSSETRFNLNHVLRDHINGGRLLQMNQQTPGGTVMRY
ncbi:transcriptional regulator family: Fungal Specific TF [Trichoderma harzianum]|nr:transcriptional regulator family: Fungal Specific TF [Trichoderma harzianum]